MGAKYILEIHPQLLQGAPCSVATPFLEWGPVDTDPERLRCDPESIRAVFFSGGSDLAPALYGEPTGSHTGPVDVRRDSIELELYNLARAANIPMLGVCRGSQFLCVAAGGKLGQHIEGHSLGHEGTHPVRALDVDGNWITFEATSSHHQAVLPPSDAEVLAYATPNRAGGIYWDGEGEAQPLEVEVEAVYYPNIRAVGFLWHPEWMKANDPCVVYSRRIALSRLRL